jgi:hypothetical protein
VTVDAPYAVATTLLTGGLTNADFALPAPWKLYCHQGYQRAPGALWVGYIQPFSW